jgi:hypothetical protein
MDLDPMPSLQEEMEKSELVRRQLSDTTTDLHQHGQENNEKKK